MTIHFACATCKTPNQAEDRLAGRTLKCFTCGSLFVIPAAPAPVAPVAPVAAFVPPPMPAHPTMPEPVAPAFELDDDGDLFGGNGDPGATPAPANFEEDIDIAALIEDEPAVAAEAHVEPAAAYDFGEPMVEAAEVMELEVVEEVEPPKPQKKKGRR
jgi:hypothetical protein